jgi:hypothetical protein
MAATETGRNSTPVRLSLMGRLRRIIFGIWNALLAIARRLRAFNVGLAQKFHMSQEWPQRLFKIEVGVLLASGATMIQLAEYAFAVALWIVLALIWVSKVLDWKTIKGSSRHVAIVKGFNVVLALVVVTTMIVWTNIKRNENDWTALQQLWTHNKLRVLTVVTSPEYKAGTVIEGIPWQPYYTQLDVIINNPTDASYEDVNVLIRPDYPVARIVQMSNLSDVSFEDKMGLTMRMMIEQGPLYADGTSGPFGPASPYVFIATNAGYKVHCGRIPPDSSLRLVMALVDIKKFGKSIPYKPNMVIPMSELPKESDFPAEIEFNTGETYWYVIPGVRNFFTPRPPPKKLTIEGSYIADNKRQRIKQEVFIK